MTYTRIHDALHVKRGPASSHLCPCGKPAQDWAYQHTGVELIDPDNGRSYSQDLADYTAMCRSCHQILDRSRNPEWVEKIRSHAQQMGSRPKTFEQLSAAGKLGIIAAAPKLVEHRQTLATKNRTEKRRCLECGNTYSRVGLGRHQQAGGHTGWEDVV